MLITLCGQKLVVTDGHHKFCAGPDDARARVRTFLELNINRLD